MVDNDDRVCERLRGNDPTLERLVLKEPRTLHCCPSFEEFVSALRGNTTVHTVMVSQLVVQTTEETKLCSLLEGLGGLENLEEVEFAIPHINTQKRFTGHSLNQFLRAARHLKTLVLWPFILFANAEEIALVAEALREHPSLRSIVWMNFLLGSGSDNALSIDPILYSLASAPKLHTLHLSTGFRVQGHIQPISEAALCNLLETSASLQALALRNFGLTNKHCIAMARLLTEYRNTSKIKILDLRSNSIGSQGYESLVAMLKDNFLVELIETDARSGDLLKQINFYLFVNRAGRFTLLKDPHATRDQCVEVFINCRDNVDASFYLLRRNPSVCDRKAHN